MKLLFLIMSLLIFPFILLLQGCVTAAITSTAAVSIKAMIDPRTVGTQIDDNTLELRINKAFSRNEHIRKETRINAIVYQGKVLLVGQSPNVKLASHAEQIAMGVNGTIEVYNEIRRSQPINFYRKSLDTWITMKIRSKLLGSDQIKSSNMIVITENSEVFFLGIVTEREGEIAANIASRISGVKQVTTAFTYIK